MQKVLIVSDKPSMSSILENEFSLAGWSSNSISMATMMRESSASMHDCQCLVHFIDTDFRKRFDSTIEDIGTMFRECSRTSLYLVFEGDYDPSFASWLGYTKRLFKLAMHYPNLQKAIQEIIWLESTGAPSAAYLSPMDSN